MSRQIILVVVVLLSTIFATAQDYAVITPDNVHELERVASLRPQSITDAWFEDNETLISEEYSHGDKWIFDINNMSAPPTFVPIPSPDSEFDLGWNYREHVSKDHRWIITFDDVIDAETNQQVFSYPGYASSLHGHQIIGNYLVISRWGYHHDEIMRCQKREDCPHQIIIMNTDTQTLYDELFVYGVDQIRSALNNTHLAIITENETQFYSLQADRLYHAFTLPVVLSNFNATGTFATDMLWEKDFNSVSLWNLATRSLHDRFFYQEGELPTSVKVTADGQYLAVTTTATLVNPYRPVRNDISFLTKTLVVWHIPTRQRLTTISQLYAPRLYIEFSPDGQFLAVATQDPIYDSATKETFFVKLFDTKTGKQIAQVDNGYFDATSVMRFSPDSNVLAIIFRDGRIMLIDTATGGILEDITEYSGSTSHSDFSAHFVPSVLSQDIPDWWTSEMLKVLDDCPIVDLHPTEPIVLCNRRYQPSSDGLLDEPARYVNVNTGYEIPILFDFVADTAIITAKFSPDGNQLLMTGGEADRDVIIWDTNSNKIVKRIDPEYAYYVREFVYLNDGQYVASRSHGIIWDAETFEIAFRLPASASPNSIGTYSEAGNWIALHDETTETIKIWKFNDVLEGNNPQPIHILEGYEHAVINTNSDGTLMLIGQETVTQVLETQNLMVIHQFRDNNLNTQFTDDGRFIIYTNGNCFMIDYCSGVHFSTQVWAVPISE